MHSKYRLISCTPLGTGQDNYAVVVWDGEKNLAGTISGPRINELVNTGNITGLTALETQHVAGERKTAA